MSTNHSEKAARPLADGFRLGEHQPNKIWSGEEPHAEVRSMTEQTPNTIIAKASNAALLVEGSTGATAVRATAWGGSDQIRLGTDASRGDADAADARSCREVARGESPVHERRRSAHAECFIRPTPRGKRVLWTSSKHGDHAVRATREGDRSMVASNPTQLQAQLVDATSQRNSSAEWPLVLLGPGGDYARRYVAVGATIRRERPAFAGVSGASAAAAPSSLGVTAMLRRFARRFEEVAIEIFSIETAGEQSPAQDRSVHAPALPLTPATTQASCLIEIKETSDEPDTQAAEGAADRARFATETGLLANHAGDRRRTPRQQGHGVRARRGADREGCAAPRCEQGTLFNGLG
jgi:hypothetical protein